LTRARGGERLRRPAPRAGAPAPRRRGIWGLFRPRTPGEAPLAGGPFPAPKPPQKHFFFKNRKSTPPGRNQNTYPSAYPSANPLIASREESNYLPQNTYREASRRYFIPTGRYVLYLPVGIHTYRKVFYPPPAPSNMAGALLLNVAYVARPL